MSLRDIVLAYFPHHSLRAILDPPALLASCNYYTALQPARTHNKRSHVRFSLDTTIAVSISILIMLIRHRNRDAEGAKNSKKYKTNKASVVLCYSSLADQVFLAKSFQHLQ